MPRRPPFARLGAAPAPSSRPAAKAERDAFYSSARWMRLRAAFLREHPLCEDCERSGRLTSATIAHHAAERLARPDLALDPGNLVPLCSPCHTARHKEKAR